MFSADEYFYVVKARDVPGVCAGSGHRRCAVRADPCTAGTARHRRDTQWKAWLTAQPIPFELSVWR
jgi:hypothetical protein